MADTKATGTADTIGTGDVPRLRPGAFVRLIAGEVVVDLLDSQSPDRGQRHVLNQVGGRVVQLCDGRNVSEIAKALTEEYAVDLETALRDVRALLGMLRSAGVVEVFNARAVNPEARKREPRLIFRDACGRELTTADLANANGRIRWELIGAERVDPKAVELHQEGRRAGERGDYDRALVLLEQAQRLAPDWPYPTYDAAFSCLLSGDSARAETLYARVDQISPRGFFTAKTTLHSLRRESRGELPSGLTRAFSMLAWMRDPAKKRALLQRYLAAHSDFAPAWKELHMLSDDDDEKAAAIERGLAGQADDETVGVLRVNQALLLDRRGHSMRAIEILGTLALDPASTLTTEALAKMALAVIVRRSGYEA